jgi:hypothetical protein
MTLNFFAPHQGYAVRDAVTEFREMVAAFHAAGIEVWLDVVYNHTCEGDSTGPTYSWRGIDNSSDYVLKPDGEYVNDTGCGNMLRCANDGARALMLERASRSTSSRSIASPNPNPNRNRSLDCCLLIPLIAIRYWPWFGIGVCRVSGRAGCQETVGSGGFR